MTSEKRLTEKESLALINKVIHEAQGYMFETGISALIYGFSIFICSVLSFLTERNVIHFSFSPFYCIVPVFFVQSFIQYREDKKKKAKTFTDEAIDFVWIGFFLTVFVALCAAWAGYGYMSVSIILLTAGFAVFLTGMIARFKYNFFAAALCWLLAIISFFTQNSYIYLLLAVAAIFVWIVPGFILNSAFKKQQYATGKSND